MLIHRTEPCHHAQWTTPVHVHLPRCAALEIYSPLVALDLLVYRWPDDHGPEYETARLTCLAAVSGQGGLETARESFMLASSHAHILDLN